MTYTSFQILSPLRYGGKVYVYGDPSVEYFGTQHIPFALVALFFEFFISLPICFLLLFAPCLSKRLNMVKLRLMPFLDEFQACYRPKHRWFAGFYFLARQLLYLVMMLTSHNLPQNKMLLHYLNGLILIVHASVQPYKLKWLNLIDTILLLDIFFISFFSNDPKEDDIAYILILVPSIYLIIIIAILLFKRILLLFRSFHHFCMPKDESSEVLKSTSTSVVGIDGSSSVFSDDSFYRDDGEREPLLQEADDAENHKKTTRSLSGSEGWRNPFSTSSSVGGSGLIRFPPR